MITFQAHLLKWLLLGAFFWEQFFRESGSQTLEEDSLLALVFSPTFPYLHSSFDFLGSSLFWFRLTQGSRLWAGGGWLSN